MATQKEDERHAREIVDTREQSGQEGRPSHAPSQQYEEPAEIRFSLVAPKPSQARPQEDELGVHQLIPHWGDIPHSFFEHDEGQRYEFQFSSLGMAQVFAAGIRLVNESTLIVLKIMRHGPHSFRVHVLDRDGR